MIILNWKSYFTLHDSFLNHIICRLFTRYLLCLHHLFVHIHKPCFSCVKCVTLKTWVSYKIKTSCTSQLLHFNCCPCNLQNITFDVSYCTDVQLVWNGACVSCNGWSETVDLNNKGLSGGGSYCDALRGIEWRLEKAQIQLHFRAVLKYEGMRWLTRVLMVSLATSWSNT